MGLKPPTAVSKLGQFHSPHIVCAFTEETLKAVGHFYLVPVPKETKGPTQGNGETCYALMVSIYKMSRVLCVGGYKCCIRHYYHPGICLWGLYVLVFFMMVHFPSQNHLTMFCFIERGKGL